MKDKKKAEDKKEKDAEKAIDKAKASGDKDKEIEAKESV